MALITSYVCDYSSLNRAIVVLMHGFNDAASHIVRATRLRFMQAGAFVIVPEMRGRGLATGTPDASAREIMDIIGAIDYVKSNFARYVDANQVHIVGYSGGGGNALACAAKYPDTFNSIVSFFGMSDYGHDAANGWYQNGGGAQSPNLATWVGGTPATVPNSYYARYHVDAAAQNYDGQLFMFHDDADSSVPVVHSQLVDAAFTALEKTNCDYHESSAIDDDRWQHGYPETITDLVSAETFFLPDIVAKNFAAWAIPASGEVVVAGYIVTKRFSIWLGGLTEAAAGAGLDEYATVDYNTTTGEYTVTPLTGSMDVFIKQGSLTASQNISSPTVLTVT